MIPWDKPPHRTEELLELLQFTTIGKEKWTEFTFRAKKNNIQFLPFPQELRLKLQENAQENDGLTGAAFVTDGITGTIYYDQECSMGAILPLLFHEIVHSLDESLWRAARAGFSSEHQRRETHFAAECRAYSAQHQFMLEMKRKFAGYDHFLKTSFPNIPFFHRVLLPHEISKLYRTA